MKETGVIMSGNHPKLILDGTKTMTRRTWGLELINENPDYMQFQRILNFEGHTIAQFRDVRTNTPVDVELAQHITVPWNEWLEAHTQYGGSTGNWDKWHSPRFVPKWACRIWRKITGLRAERLQQITEEDAVAEGCTVMVGTTIGGNMGLASARYSFMKLWDSLNAKRGHGWDKNDWVFVIGV